MSCRSTSCAVCAAKCHLVSCPKYRRPVLVGGVETRLKEIVAEVVDDLDGRVIEVGAMPDQLHVLAAVPPTVALPVLVRRLKGRSSRVLREEFPRLLRLPPLWTRSWFVSTVVGTRLEVVRQYVENQKQAA